MGTSTAVSWVYKVLTVASLTYCIFIASTVQCATTRTSSNCYNVSKQIVVNETTEEWCATLSSVYCYWTTAGCYCNVTREVAKIHVTTVCEGDTDISGNATTTTSSTYISRAGTVQLIIADVTGSNGTSFKNITAGQTTQESSVTGKTALTNPVINVTVTETASSVTTKDTVVDAATTTVIATEETSSVTTNLTVTAQIINVTVTERPSSITTKDTVADAATTTIIATEETPSITTNLTVAAQVINITVTERPSSVTTKDTVADEATTTVIATKETPSVTTNLTVAAQVINVTVTERPSSVTTKDTVADAATTTVIATEEKPSVTKNLTVAEPVTNVTITERSITTNDTVADAATTTVITPTDLATIVIVSKAKSAMTTKAGVRHPNTTEIIPGEASSVTTKPMSSDQVTTLVGEAFSLANASAISEPDTKQNSTISSSESTKPNASDIRPTDTIPNPTPALVHPNSERGTTSITTNSTTKQLKYDAPTSSIKTETAIPTNSGNTTEHENPITPKPTVEEKTTSAMFVASTALTRMSANSSGDLATSLKHSLSTVSRKIFGSGSVSTSTALIYNATASNRSFSVGIGNEMTLVDGGDQVAGKTGALTALPDEYIAAIAVICSLVFSILLSLTVFFIQRKRRGCREAQAAAGVVQVEGGVGDIPAEEQAFLPPSTEKRYIHVQPANRNHNVYEDVQSRPENEHTQLSLIKGKPAACYYVSNPSSSTGPAKHTSAAAANTPAGDTSHTEPQPATNAASSSSKISTPSPVNSTAGLNSKDEEKPSVDSASSLRLNTSEDHYENVPTSDL